MKHDINFRRGWFARPAIRRGFCWGVLFLFISVISTGCNREVSQVEPAAMHRANPARTGVYDTQGLESFTDIQWQFQTGDWIFAAPAISDDTVYIASYDGQVYAINQDTGQEQWRFATTEPILASPAIADGIVLVGGMDGNAYGLDGESGAEQWRLTIGGGFVGSPAVVDQLGYFAGLDGVVVALDIHSGSEVWRFEKAGTTIAFSPAVADGAIFIPVSDGVLYVLDAETGTELWSYDPAVGTSDVFQPAGDVVVANGRVYYMTSNTDLRGILHNVDLETHELVWRYQTPSEVFAGPTAMDGFLIWGGLSGNLYGVGAETGELMWTFPTGDAIFSAAAGAGDLVYVGSADKNLYAVDIRT
jgi:eukaryotic-like serine/threonine-protein kinase